MLRKHLPPPRYVMSGQELKLLTGTLNNWAFICVAFSSAVLPDVFHQSAELGAALIVCLFYLNLS